MLTFINLIIGAIGCITGSISLIIIIRQDKFRKGKLMVETSERGSTCYFNAKEFHVEGYETNYSAAVSLKITNKSAYPTTIDGITIIKDKNIANHVPDFKCQLKIMYEVDPFKCPQIGQTESTEYLLLPPCPIPQRLEPFETKYLSACFPFFDSFVNDSNEPISAKINVESSRENVQVQAKISDIHSLIAEAELSN